MAREEPPIPATQLVVAPKTVISSNAEELRSLHSFRERALFQITSFAHDDFWSKLVLQVAHTEPSVRHAVFALSYFHERYRSGNRLIGSGSDFGLKQYNLAIRTLLGAPEGPNHLCARAICCVVFIIIEVSIARSAPPLLSCR